MIINDSDKDWEIIRPDGIVVIVKSGDAYDPTTDKILTIKKPKV